MGEQAQPWIAEALELDSELCSLRQAEARWKEEAWSNEPAHGHAGNDEAAEVGRHLQKVIAINIGLSGYAPVTGTHADATSSRLADVHRDDCAKALKSRLQAEVDAKRKELQTKQSELMEHLGCRRCQADSRVGPRSPVQTSALVHQPDYLPKK